MLCVHLALGDVLLPETADPLLQYLSQKTKAAAATDARSDPRGQV